MHLSHVVADGFTAALFIKEWATTTTGLINGHLVSSTSSSSFAFASLFPSRDLSAHVKQARKPILSNIKGKVITKRFLFNENAINSLKLDNVSKFKNLKPPTRVQVVISVIWKALILTSKLPNCTLYPTINLRGKTALTAPPIDNPCACGNFAMQVPTRFKGENGVRVAEEMELHNMIKLLRTSLQNALGNYSKISSPNALFLEAARNVNEVQEDIENEEVEVYHLSSLCRMPLYEIDFGWGKPEWVTIPEIPWEIVLLFDAKCGTGIEAIVSLNEVDMHQFELDPTILSFTT